MRRFFFSFCINCPFKHLAFVYQLWFSHNNLQLLTYMICIYNKQHNKYLKSFKKWNNLCSVWVMLILNLIFESMSWTSFDQISQILKLTIQSFRLQKWFVYQREFPNMQNICFLCTQLGPGMHIVWGGTGRPKQGPNITLSWDPSRVYMRTRNTHAFAQTQFSEAILSTARSSHWGVWHPE